MKSRLKFIDIPTEQTTAITDLILATIASVFALYLFLADYRPDLKAALWISIFGLVGLAALLGAIVHGFEMSENARLRLWQPLHLLLALTVALIPIAVIYDLWGENYALSVLPVTLGLGMIFFGFVLIYPHNFLAFFIYQTIAMFFALIGYSWLALLGRLDGAWFMVAGIAITMVAAAVQTRKSICFKLIWAFDHNGLYHFIQMAALLFLLLGLHISLSPQSGSGTGFSVD